MKTARDLTVPPSAAIPRAESPRPARTLDFLPRGNLLDDVTWRRRHTLLRWLLAWHVPGLLGFGLLRGFGLLTCAFVVVPVLACLGLAPLVARRRLASFFVTAGLVYCSSALVGLSGGAIEAHFHFFILIGFIALYQDWVPFLWNIVFTVVSHGLGSAWSSTLIFNHHEGQRDPWLWSLIHGSAVLAGCVGVVIFWRYSEDEQNRTLALRSQLEEIERRRFASDLLVNLARRNQALLQRQLGIINGLEDTERDADRLAQLFRVDHLATRIRRNAESLLVLSGEDPPRTWSHPVTLRDVVQAAIAETEDLDRVAFDVDEEIAVLGHIVTDLTHLLAELLENAVRFSPPMTHVTVRVRDDPRSRGTQVLTVEDWGLGMPAEEMAAANELLAQPREVDVSASRRLGLHVVSRLANRHGVDVQLITTAASGVTARVILPPAVFAPRKHDPGPAGGLVGSAAGRPQPARAARLFPSAESASGRPRPYVPVVGGDDAWRGWRDGGPPHGATSERAAGPSSAGLEPRGPAVGGPAMPARTPLAGPPDEVVLARRTPQAHLAPQLRRGSGDIGNS